MLRRYYRYVVSDSSRYISMSVFSGQNSFTYYLGGIFSGWLKENSSFFEVLIDVDCSRFW